MNLELLKNTYGHVTKNLLYQCNQYRNEMKKLDELLHVNLF